MVRARSFGALAQPRAYGRMSQESLGQMSYIRALSERLKCHLDHLDRVGTYYPLLR
jgi:hypothetical protein